MTVRILAFSGSLKPNSINQKLVQFAAGIAQTQSVQTTVVHLKDLNLPLLDAEDHSVQGFPQGALKLKALMKSHNAFLIASPEHNSSLTPALKNALDWATIPHGNEKPLECFAGKVAGLCATSPGALGGLRGLDHVREILSNIKVHVVPTLIAVGMSGKVFDDQGSLTDEKHAKALCAMVEQVIATTRALHGQE